MPDAPGRESSSIQELRAAYQAQPADEPVTDDAVLRAFLDGGLPPSEWAATAEQLLADRSASRRAAALIRRQSATPTGWSASRLARWLDTPHAQHHPSRPAYLAATWLGAAPASLPARAVSFASEPGEPFQQRLDVGGVVTVTLVEHAGGRLAAHLRTDDPDLAGARLRLVFTPTADGELLAFDVVLEDLGDAGIVGYVALGPLPDVLARLGQQPECAVLLAE